MPTLFSRRRPWCDAQVDEHSRSDLAAVLRRIAVEPGFAADVRSAPRRALDGYHLSGDEIGALAMWLEQRADGLGMTALFEPPPDGDTGGERDSG